MPIGDSEMSARLDVTITVMDVDDDWHSRGLSQRQPQVDRPVTANITDPDGGITGTTWKWFRYVVTDADGEVAIATLANVGDVCNDESSTLCLIEDEESSTYTPSEDDLVRNVTIIAAMASYSDNLGYR